MKLTERDRRGFASVLAGGLILVFAANTTARGMLLVLLGGVVFFRGLLWIRFQ